MRSVDDYLWAPFQQGVCVWLSLLGITHLVAVRRGLGAVGTFGVCRGHNERMNML